MDEKFIVVNIKEYIKLGDQGINALKKIFSKFNCNKNKDVEHFLLNQSIEFSKKNQSVTYLILNQNNGLILGYFTITIKPIIVHGECFSKNIQRKFARVSEQNTSDGTYNMSAYLIAQIGKNFHDDVRLAITGKRLLEIALDKIMELQYMVGGMVVFLEADNNEKLMKFYELENGFKRFDVRQTKDEKHTLVQLLKVL